MISPCTETNLFRFKQFSVAHANSSMKVGVDAVLIGAWADVNGKKGLDVGCGCGIIALMLAQRNPLSHITAIDIDVNSVIEAKTNFIQSKWKERLFAGCNNIQNFSESDSNKETFDFIVSNPPYFKSGIFTPESPRERARHQATLSPLSLLKYANLLLKPGGTLSLIMPAGGEREIMEHGYLLDLHLFRRCTIFDRPGKQSKRIMLSFQKGTKPEKISSSELFLRGSDNSYSDEYAKLTQDFYLQLKK